MRLRPVHHHRRALLVVAAAVAALLTGCTGRGGGTLPPKTLFNGQASFGFSFSCEDPGGINPPTGRLHIELSYADHGTNPIGGPFSVHGTADTLDPVLESALCIGQNPPPGGNQLIFLGRFRPTSTTPAGFAKRCTSTALVPCRFEVIVRDNDRNQVPSRGDDFAIQLSSATAVTSELDPATVFYARAGTLSGGNLTVD